MALGFLLGFVGSIEAAVVSFGSGGNRFDMEFVTIGNPGNANDSLPSNFKAGSVGYTFQMGKYEVSESMFTKYSAEFGNANNLAIGNFDSYGPDKPGKWVSWNNAARFVNWLNTSSGGFAAYKFTSGGVNDNIALWTPAETLDYDSKNPYRSKRAKYVLPTYNEWHKAAFYDPTKNGGAGGYWTYATGSDSAPASVAFGTDPGTAVYGRGFNNPPADIKLAGGLSPYGVMGMNGNIMEWEESSFDLSNSDPTLPRAFRGGNWADSGAAVLRKDQGRGFINPNQGGFLIGFRVASLTSEGGGEVPEPSSMVIGALLGLGGVLARRRSGSRSKSHN
jgi:formylglycine-generating enzyme required for sulfatase activity